MLGAQFPEILAAARAGADWAWTSVYRDISPAVLGYLRARGAREPEDLTGEVFLQLVRDLPRFAGDEHDFRAWVFVIAHHRLVDEGRRRARRPVDLAAEVPETREPDDVETEVLHGAAEDRVRRIIEQLAPDQRDVLLLRVLGELTVEEVATAIGKSAGAVKALQRRGLAGVKLALSREGVTL
jgi:RNA polymerase sigma-70 factor (ECF subfamily)